MKQKFILIAGLILGAFQPLMAQLTIENCQQKARENYPQIKQYDLIRQTEEYSLSNANKGYLPQFSLSGKATYQSEVTQLPIKLPGISVSSLSKDQYQATAEVNQLIWDGGVIKSQKNITRASSSVDVQKNEVDLYALTDRVNQLFFGILSLNEQLVQNDLLQKELQTNYEKISAYMQGGIGNQADLDAIRVEQLKAKQRRMEMAATQKSFCDMLAAFIGEPVTKPNTLIKPEKNIVADTNNRPELKLFDAQSSLLDSQISSVKAGNMPKLNLFVQGGIGRPGLNMLNNDFAPFYIGGVRLSWNFGGFYTQKNNLRKIELDKHSVSVQKETFLFNSQLKSLQQKNEIAKIGAVIEDDDEIIRLRTNIKNASQAKVLNGTLSVSDLIRDVNAESQAKQDKALHEVQLLQAIYNLKETTNN
ncbi:TolC family protein [Paludibacter sp.]|uniref:TolC family protein n=1 Tax=Paludibacter sp. TaxID=1898105 RepID=UPI0013545777|nr:TolC family protein [Paludibacter sp.]MTK53078.1 transporter [Paludibacter sp.]